MYIYVYAAHALGDFSVDLASGWKGYIEGAMEQGTKAAMQIVKDLQLHSRAV